MAKRSIFEEVGEGGKPKTVATGVIDRAAGGARRPIRIWLMVLFALVTLMIAVGGLTEFAAGNKASIVRYVGNEQQTVPVRIEDLLQDGDITANVPVLPGDVLVIPESWL